MGLWIGRYGCRGEELACDMPWSSPAGSYLYLAAGQTIAIAVERRDSSAGPFQLNIGLDWGYLPIGDVCEPSSPNLTCAQGACVRGDDGQYRCRAPACSNGRDDDGDGKLDWPDDPGCASPLDDDESDPTPAPVCSNGVDDDGDGAVDYPANLQCGAASGESERFCDLPIAGSLGALGLPIWFTGAMPAGSGSLTGTCGGDGSSEDIYEWTAPVAGSYWLGATGYGFQPVLYVRDGACDGAELACTSGWGGGGAGLGVSLAAGQTVALVIDGQGGSGLFDLYLGLYEGGVPVASSCTKQGTCVGDASCLPDGAGGRVCRRPACSDGTDNDGDGKVDWLYDPGCSSPEDDDETDPPSIPACSDGIDNDGDGKGDYPEDPKCTSASGTSESFCSTPVVAVLDDMPTPLSIQGTTEGAADEVAPATCGGSGAPEHVYRWTAPVSGTYRIDTIGSSYETVLYVRRLSCGGEELACDAGGSGGKGSVVYVWLEAGEVVAIVVDGRGSGAAEYQFHVRPTSESGFCRGDKDADGDGLAGCLDPDCWGNYPCDYGG